MFCGTCIAMPGVLRKGAWVSMIYAAILRPRHSETCKRLKAPTGMASTAVPNKANKKQTVFLPAEEDQTKMGKNKNSNGSSSHRTNKKKHEKDFGTSHGSARKGLLFQMHRQHPQAPMITPKDEPYLAGLRAEQGLGSPESPCKYF